MAKAENTSAKSGNKLVVAYARRRMPIRPSRAEPISQTAAGTGTGATFASRFVMSTISVSTQTNAQLILAGVDAMIAVVDKKRAELGAVQNRFESVVRSVQTTSENLSASRSRIVDADFAAETANLTRAQILQQAGTAILAQANSLPQNVLSLLQ